jgi:MFS family permease
MLTAPSSGGRALRWARPEGEAGLPVELEEGVRWRTAVRPDGRRARCDRPVPLALAQFICSFAGTNMNVMINDMSEDLDTTVQGIQVAITIFLLVMAALMIPGGKLTDRWGRKRCFTVGLVVYAIGALLSAAAPAWASSSWATPSWRAWARRC